MDWKTEFTWIKGSIIAGLLCSVFAGYVIMQRGPVDFKILFAVWLACTGGIYLICLAYRGVEKFKKRFTPPDKNEDE